MGTTSQKLTYLNDTKIKIRNRINSLGGSLDSDDTFRSYADELESLYNEMPKVSESDVESASLSPTREGAMAITYKGDTQQDSTPTPSSPQPIHNVSGDNTIEICGKNLFDTNYLVQGYVSNSLVDNRTTTCRTDMVLLKSGNYTFSFKYTSAKWVKCVKYANSTDTSGTFIFNSNSSNYTNTFTLESDTFVRFGIDEPLSDILENAQIQLEKGSTATSYEPYTSQSQLISLGVDMPSGYTRLDYIESSGTQYIDTGISPTTNTGIKIKANLTTENNTDKILIGSRAGSNRFWLDFDYNNGNRVIYCGFGNINNAGNYTLNTDYEISFNYNGTKKIIVNNTSYDISGTYDSTGSVPIYIFRANYSSPIAGNFKVYYCKLYEGTTLVRDLIPCKRNSDSAIGMLDLKHNVFYTNAGTGTFTYGNELVNGIELNKIGNYQDYIYKTDKWYWHKEIGKVIFKGGQDEGWSRANRSDGTTHFYQMTLSSINLGNTTLANELSNNFRLANPYTDKGNSFWLYKSGTTEIARIGFSDETIDTADKFKTWLSTHNTIVYYVLATPTDTEITDTTLLEQLETIKRSYDGVTNIFQENNDLPFILDVSALKEWE